MNRMVLEKALNSMLGVLKILAATLLFVLSVGCETQEQSPVEPTNPEPVDEEVDESVAETCPDPHEPASSDDNAARFGFEIIEIQSENASLAWVSPFITFSEFEALELPDNWMKNQPRESPVCGSDRSSFLKSPDATEDGDIVFGEHFGFRWFHAATVIEENIPMDEAGLLRGFVVKKFHELTYEVGSCMILLVSPDGEAYFRMGRDATRTCNTPTLPEGWKLVDYVVEETLVIQLFDEILVIRTDNQDSFQGPVPQLQGKFSD